MRTIVELPDDHWRPWAKYVPRRTPRAEIIRRAVGDYIKTKQSGKGRSAFGLWKKKKINALKHESKLRAEWPKP